MAPAWLRVMPVTLNSTMLTRHTAELIQCHWWKRFNQRALAFLFKGTVRPATKAGMIIRIVFNSQSARCKECNAPLAVWNDNAYYSRMNALTLCPARLLVIEDDPVLSADLHAYFNDRHHSVTLCRDGHSGLAAAAPSGSIW